LIAAVPPLAAQSVVLPLADAPFASLAVAATNATTLRREVKRSGHASRLYTLVGPERATSRLPSAVPVSTPRPEMTDDRRRVPAHDEAYWKDRMRRLTTRCADDRTVLATALNVMRGLDQWPWYDAVTELTRWTAAVQTDMRAIVDLELEAHRAGVPPGWLVLE